MRTGSPPSLLSNGERWSSSMGWSGMPKRTRRLLEVAILLLGRIIYTKSKAYLHNTKCVG